MYLYREEDFDTLSRMWPKMSGVEQLKRIKEAFKTAKRYGYNVGLIKEEKELVLGLITEELAKIS